jgi:hypothetical protein
MEKEVSYGIKQIILGITFLRCKHLPGLRTTCKLKAGLSNKGVRQYQDEAAFSKPDICKQSVNFL